MTIAKPPKMMAHLFPSNSDLGRGRAKYPLAHIHTFVFSAAKSIRWRMRNMRNLPAGTWNCGKEETSDQTKSWKKNLQKSFKVLKLNLALQAAKKKGCNGRCPSRKTDFAKSQGIFLAHSVKKNADCPFGHLPQKSLAISGRSTVQVLSQTRFDSCILQHSPFWGSLP